MTFDQIIQFRRSNRKFDPHQPVPANVVEKALEHATLAPNSSNMQLWEFHWVRDEEKKKKLIHACLNQSAARTAQELVVIVTRRDKWRQRVQWHKNLILKDAERVGRDAKSIKMRLVYYTKLMPFSYMNDGLGILGLYRRLLSFCIGLFRPIYRAEGHAQQRITVHKSAALAAENFMLSMASEEFHTCPMEGFDAYRVKRILGLPPRAEINMVIGCGKGEEPGFWGPRRRLPSEEVIIKH